MMQVVLGAMVNPTVLSCLEYRGHPDVTSVPIADLPPSETALVWLMSERSPKIEAFARAAEAVLADTPLAPYQPQGQVWRDGTAVRWRHQIPTR